MRAAVLGLGQMGAAVARRLEEAAELELVVYNRTPAKADDFVARGATRADTPAEAIDGADVCVSFVTDGPALIELVSGEQGLLAAETAGGKTLIEMSTVDPESSAGVAAATAAAGLGYLRAPVSGNPKVVAAGELTIIVSGPREEFDAQRQLLLEIGPKLHYLGDGEQARVLKLAINLILAGTSQLLAEALVIGEANGLSKQLMLEVIGSSAVGSPFIDYKSAPLVAEDYGTTFSVINLAKDLDLIVDCANRSGVPAQSAALLRQLAQACIAAGMGSYDITALVPLLEQQAGQRTELPSEIAADDD